MIFYGNEANDKPPRNLLKKSALSMKDRLPERPHESAKLPMSLSPTHRNRKQTVLD